MTDEQLIEGLKNNRQEAFRTLVGKYQAMVVSTCYYLLHDQEDAQDMGQDVFIEVYQSIHKFRQESSLATWLYRIAVNKSLNHLRRKKNKDLFVSIEKMFTSKSADSSWSEDDFSHTREREDEFEQKLQRVHHALGQLPANQKTAFVLHKYNSLSYKEIAEILEVSLSSVESLIHRAKLNLQAMFLKDIQKQK